MHTLTNFFALRPTFTFVGLQVVWYVYLLSAAVHLYVTVAGITQVLARRGVTLEIWSPNFLPLFLGTIAQLFLVRLLLEVTAIIVSNAHVAPREQ
jgi:hypothetical protein